MKTQLLTVSPAVVRVNRQTPADTIRSSQTEPPPRHDSPDDSYPQGPSQKPDWHYDPSEKPTRMTFVVGLLLSGGLHAYALWGFNDPAPEVIEPVETEFEITFMEMPPIKDLFNLEDLDEEPTPLLQRPPEFRYKYKHTVKYAEVVVDFIVDNKGKVSWAVVRSSTHEGFEDAAILGVSRWQFKPGKKKGRAVNTRMRVPLRFRITE